MTRATFDEILRGLDGDWRVTVRRGRRVVATLDCPNPCRTLSGWLAHVELDPGDYKCSVRCIGDNRAARRRALQRSGQVQTTVTVGDQEVSEPTTVITDAGPLPGSEADDWDQRAEAAQSKKHAIQKERELREEEDRLERWEKNREAGFTPLEQENRRELRELREIVKELAAKLTQPPPPAPDPIAQIAAIAKVLRELTPPAPAPAAPASSRRSLDEFRGILETMQLLREEGLAMTGSGEQPQSDAQAAFSMFRDYMKLRREVPPPMQADTPPATAPVAGPGVPVTAPQAAQPPDDPRRQRVAVLFEVIHAEMLNGTRPEDAADAIEDSDIYRLAPGSLRDAIESGVVSHVLEQTRLDLPEHTFAELLASLNDSARAQWFSRFLAAMATPLETGQKLVATPTGAAENAEPG